MRTALYPLESGSSPIMSMEITCQCWSGTLLGISFPTFCVGKVFVQLHVVSRQTGSWGSGMRYTTLSPRECYREKKEARSNATCSSNDASDSTLWHWQSGKN